MRTADEHEALPPVLAETAVSSGGYRRRWATEWVRERFWVIPAVLLLAGTVLELLQVVDVRLIKPVPGWDDCSDLAFTEITSYGASSPQVTRRLLAAYGALEAAAAPERQAGVAVRRDELIRQLAADGLPRQALRAGSMGLG
jgi:uncharacterized membrane protein